MAERTSGSNLGGGPGDRYQALAVIVTAALSTALGVLPVFLVGGLFVLMGPELGFDERGLGLAASIFFMVSAVLATPAGSLGDRLGPRRSLGIGVAGSVVSLLGIGLVAQNWGALVGFLVLGGFGNAVSQPAGNVLLTTRAPSSRQAVGFGIKQSAVPFASLLSGGTVPLLGLTIGWRWAFILSSALCLTLLLPVPTPRTPHGRRTGPVLRRPLLVLACGAALSTSAANAAAAFLVPTATARGVDVAVAGSLLALGGAVGVASRLVAGWAGGRFRLDGLFGAAILVGCGSVGLLMFTISSGIGLLVPATMIVFGAGWGWAGLFTFAVAQSHPDATGSATGMTQSGIFAGGVFGPLVFGLVAADFGYKAAWGVGVALALGGCLLIAAGRKVLMTAVAPQR